MPQLLTEKPLGGYSDFRVSKDGTVPFDARPACVLRAIGVVRRIGRISRMTPISLDSRGEAWCEGPRTAEDRSIAGRGVSAMPDDRHGRYDRY